MSKRFIIQSYYVDLTGYRYLISVYIVHIKNYTNVFLKFNNVPLSSNQ